MPNALESDKYTSRLSSAALLMKEDGLEFFRFVRMRGNSADQ